LTDPGPTDGIGAVFGLGIPELIVILVLALLVFGPRKLPELGSFLGKSLRDFRDSLDGRSDESSGPPAHRSDEDEHTPGEGGATGAAHGPEKRTD
jgi:sec-independent protein translocase protein TatA